MATSTFTRKAAKIKIERILKLLVEPMTADEVSEHLHINRRNADLYLRHMAFQKVRQIRICKWVETDRPGGKVPAFKLGSGRNVPKPPPRTWAQNYATILADPVKYAERCAKNREAWHRSKGRPTPAPAPASPFAALFGKPTTQKEARHG